MVSVSSDGDQGRESTQVTPPWEGDYADIQASVTYKEQRAWLASSSCLLLTGLGGFHNISDFIPDSYLSHLFLSQDLTPTAQLTFT